VGFTSVTNLADLLTKIVGGINESDIKLFEIDSYGNVSFNIRKKYSINTGSFNNDTSITYFIDSVGKCSELSVTAFLVSGVVGKLKFAYLPKARSSTNDNPRFFYGQKLLKEISLKTVGHPTS